MAYDQRLVDLEKAYIHASDEVERLNAEIERLRGIIARNCAWGEAKVLSSERTDADAIKSICDAADAVGPTTPAT